MSFFYITIISVITFVLLQSKKYFSKINFVIYLEYFVYVIFILGIFYYSIDVVFAMEPEPHTLKDAVNVKENVINVNNPSISLPADSLARGLTNVGVGASVGAVANAVATVVKGTSLPPVIKVGTVIAGGAAGGLLVTAANAANSIVQNNINSSKAETKSLVTVSETVDPKGPSSAFSIESIENLYEDNSVSDLLISNYYLHIIILYLLFNLIIILMINYFDFKFNFLEKIVGKKIYNYVLKVIVHIKKLNSL